MSTAEEKARHVEEQALYRKRHPERVKAAQRKWYLKNRERRCMEVREWRKHMLRQMFDIEACVKTLRHLRKEWSFHERQ